MLFGKYIFSSDLYRRKFLCKLKEHRNNINTSISKRFSFYVDVDILSDLKLYTSIEKRGFLIESKGKVYTCRDNIKLGGLKMTLKS